MRGNQMARRMPELPAYAAAVLRALEDAGFEAWVVGGWVRDALLGSASHDVDVCTAAPWQESERALLAAGLAVHRTGTQHGTVTAVSEGKPVEVCYAFQDFSSVPSFYQIPKDRTKPFGTVHAVLCAEKYINEPFAVVNADDYYGVDGFASMNQCLQGLKDGEAAMVGYYLKNTVSENGTVTRGVCSQENGLLTKVTETFKIQPFADGTIRDTATSEEGVILDPNALVSMNFWGFVPGVFKQMEAYFDAFLRGLAPDAIKAECLLPIMVDDLMRKKEMIVHVLSTNATWFGITYPQDKPYVQQELKKLHDQGVYPPSLH